ncbi:MAG: DUF3362 domain-containing protein, partial [Bacteroidota bacterium]
IRNHISGRLKVAPEHTEDTTLKIMRKPSFSFFREFKEKFKQINARYHLNQQIIPYFISAHPGTALADMKTLYKKTRSEGFRLEQVQLFTPTPMTLSSVIYYSGIDPFTGKKVAVEKSKEGRKNQHEAFFNGDPKHKTQRGR